MKIEKNKKHNDQSTPPPKKEWVTGQKTQKKKKNKKNKSETKKRIEKREDEVQARKFLYWSIMSFWMLGKTGECFRYSMVNSPFP